MPRVGFVFPLFYTKNHTAVDPPGEKGVKHAG
jgi:hypothetical protein